MTEEDLGPSVDDELDIDEVRQEFELARTWIKQIDSLRQQEGWKLFQDLLSKNAENRQRDNDVRPMLSVEEVLKKNATIGELQGIMFARTFMDRVYEDAVETVDKYREVLKNADE